MGNNVRRTSMTRSYRVSMRTSMGTLSIVPSIRGVVPANVDDYCNFEEDFCNMTFSGPGAE